MAYYLTESQTEIIRWMVQQHRAVRLPEEFEIVWTTEGILIPTHDGHPDNIPRITRGTLDVLDRAGLLIGDVSLETRVYTSDSQPSVSRETTRERSRRLTLTAKAFEAVDSDFGDTPVTPDEFSDITRVGETPVEIQQSLELFRKDHPNPATTAFILMQFGQTKAHYQIVGAVREELSAHGITGVRADDREYHDDLFPNVLTYMHGCGMGIAIFERIEAEKFNPNVALEVGYMFAMRKPVCLLKDQTLHALHTDLVGKLFRAFDPQDPSGSIPLVISKWLLDKRLPKS